MAFVKLASFVAMMILLVCYQSLCLIAKSYGGYEIRMFQISKFFQTCNIQILFLYPVVTGKDEILFQFKCLKIKSCLFL
jgi:uncharacterized membrane protein YphA (DoxX/SURF4 family)